MTLTPAAAPGSLWRDSEGSRECSPFECTPASKDGRVDDDLDRYDGGREYSDAGSRLQTPNH